MASPERKSEFMQGWDQIYVPSTHLEHVLFYVMFGINLTNILIILYAILNRSYLPIKSKQVWITAGIGVGSTLFNVSFNASTGMIGYDGAWKICMLWAGWGMVTLGLGIFLSFINMRLIIYYRVFITRKTHSYKAFTVRKFLRCYWPVLALWFPSLLSSILTQFLPGTMSARQVLDNGVLTCDFNYNYLYWVFSYFAAQVFYSWFLYFRIRRIAKAFNEFRLALATLLIFTSILVANIVISCIGGTVHSWGRILLAVLNTAFFNSYFWLILGPPIYGHIFSREKTLRTFLDDMHHDGLMAQQNSLGNAHKHLYGVDEPTDTYVQASGESGKMLSTHENEYEQRIL